MIAQRCLDPRPITGECCGTCRHWGGPIWVRPGILYPCERAEGIARSMARTAPRALVAVSMEYRDGDGCPIHAETEPGRERTLCRTPREDDAPGALRAAEAAGAAGPAESRRSGP